uniref:Molybdopterin synthase sulfur carrier subunit n=1 Tax=Candidatus Kentrum sp. DK TaxID=2126562 RepID=A0A450T564_9GAMM|nr:MAG: molybdopterin synthase sulfur carrier subunit [Candidatus Kentron sp. DK]
MPNATIVYRVKLFAGLKEEAGKDEWVHEGERILTGRELLQAFFDQYPARGKLREVTRVAINHAFCQQDSSVAPEDEVAFIPPVSGG